MDNNNLSAANSSQRTWIIISAVLGLFGVALGAFGAHVLKEKLSPEMMDIFRTGVQYQLIHSVVMLSAAFSGNKIFMRSGIFFLAGIILFSFSLYIYSVTGIRFFAMITPFGGVSFLTGWLSLIINALRKLNTDQPK